MKKLKILRWWAKKLKKFPKLMLITKSWCSNVKNVTRDHNFIRRHQKVNILVPKCFLTHSKSIETAHRGTKPLGTPKKINYWCRMKAASLIRRKFWSKTGSSKKFYEVESPINSQNMGPGSISSLVKVGFYVKSWNPNPKIGGTHLPGPYINIPEIGKNKNEPFRF